MADRFPFDPLEPVPQQIDMPAIVRADVDSFGTARPAHAQPPSPGTPSHAGPAFPEADTHLLDYVRVLYKRRSMVAAVWLIAFISAVVYTFTATPIYRARVQLLIEVENQNVVSFKEVVEQEKSTADYYQTQYRILQSRSLARRTIDTLKLWNHPYLDPTQAVQKVTLRSVLTVPVAYVRHLVKPPAKALPRAENETAIQSMTIDRFLSGLTVSPIRNSRLMELTYDSPDPEFAAKLANGLSQAYIEQSLEFKYNASREASDWLGQRMGEQKKQVEASEAALQLYREQTDSVSLEDKQNVVVQKLADLNAAVTRAKTERIQKEAVYNQVHAIQDDRTALDNVGAVLSNTFIQQQKTEIAELQRQQVQLAERLGPRHPDMVKLASAIQSADAKLQLETAKVVQSLKNDYLASLSQEQSLTAALESQKRDALALNRKGIDYGALQRDASSNQQIFDSLMQRTKETGISGALKNSNIRIVDPAEVPRGQSSPKTMFNLVLGLIGGSMLAAGSAFFFDYLDNRIKSPAEIKSYLGLAFLGIIPQAAMTGTESPLLNKGVKANFAEAFRTLRSNLLFSVVDEGGRSIVITSTGPGEGKTIVASNLALALAQAGQRVILVDADMRRPRVHAVFSDRQEPGLSNVLVGEVKASEAVRQTTAQGLWILPAGHIPPNPAELLGSKRFKDFVATLTAHFDWVLIDTPPVMAVTDAPIVAHIAGGVMFVVGSEMTSRTLAQTAVEQLVNANGRMIGAVLNRADLEHNAYYYSQYYRREYGEYYTKTA